MPNPNAPFFPIIYVRGYAMTPTEIDATSADPFCGFNLGSTVYRAVADPNKQPRKFYFQSPVVRLVSDYKYEDVYENGADILDPSWSEDALGVPTGNLLSSRSIIIYRYYEEASRLLGNGRVPTMEQFADGLNALILRVRELVVANPKNATATEDFKCYLVAHSMGGLVARAFLQRELPAYVNAQRAVAKLFTYATPHNGIELAGVNVPSWLSLADMNNFDRKRMREYLGLEDLPHPPPNDRADWLPESKFSSNNVFCLVGTNRADYDTAMGLSRTFVGHGSDGLVKIENATLTGVDDQGRATRQCAKAFAFRSHSGFFGIVNSEEAYQNLVRFLFGDVRIDIWLDITEIRLPSEVQEQRDKNKQVEALYKIELLASARGRLWTLTRRKSEEDSVACFSQTDWDGADGLRSEYLSTAFLMNLGKVNPNSPYLAYAVNLAVLVPDYEIDNRLWLNGHYEGGNLFRDALVVKIDPPDVQGQKWNIATAWQGSGVNLTPVEFALAWSDTGCTTVRVPLPSDGAINPGIEGALRFEVSLWNNDRKQLR